MNRKITAAFLLLFTTSATAQHAHQAVAENGQSQFAAIAEIVALLRKNPSTDWTLVNIDGLRDHLIDMDNVTTRTSVEKTTEGLAVLFRVTGDAETALSAKRMITAHAPMLENVTGWGAATTTVSDGVELVVTAKSQDEVRQIEGLGFYGLMTIGAHHQQHHLMMAMGHNPH
jgi:hypothetical protein